MLTHLSSLVGDSFPHDDLEQRSAFVVVHKYLEDGNAFSTPVIRFLLRSG
jgi:hypothetical protein